jgi:hypothetical protein
LRRERRRRNLVDAADRENGMTGRIEARLCELGIELPPASAPVANHGDADRRARATIGVASLPANFEID